MSGIGMNRQVILRLYRSIYRVLGNFERHPELYALVHMKRPMQLTPIGEKRLKKPTQAEIFYSVKLRKLMSDNFVLPLQGVSFASSEDVQESVLEKIKKEFRLHCIEHSESVRVAGGFTLLRRLSDIWEDYKKHQKQQAKKSIVPYSTDIGNVSYASQLAPGVMLAANPLLFGPLKRSVILILKHDVEGTYGICINKPLSTPISSIVPLSNAITNLSDEAMEIFSKHTLFYGGRVHRLNMLHPFPSAGGNLIPMCTTPTFSGGSIDAVAKLFKTESVTEGDIQFYLGCYTWLPQKLMEEISMHYWIPIQAQPDIVLKFVNNGMVYYGYC